MAMNTNQWAAVVNNDMEAIVESDGDEIHWVFHEQPVFKDSMPIIGHGSSKKATFIVSRVKTIMTFDTFHDLMRAICQAQDDFFPYPVMEHRAKFVGFKEDMK